MEYSMLEHGLLMCKAQKLDIGKSAQQLLDSHISLRIQKILMEIIANTLSCSVCIERKYKNIFGFNFERDFGLFLKCRDRFVYEALWNFEEVD